MLLDLLDQEANDDAIDDSDEDPDYVNQQSGEE